jgi:hypothetical protein
MWQCNDARSKGLSVYDPLVHYDVQRKGPWSGWCHAWETHRRFDTTHHVVLQDDILFCADLPHTLIAMATARPVDVISGFLPRKSVDVATQHSLNWVRTSRYLWAQCTMMPVSVGVAGMQWIDMHEGTLIAKEWHHHDDVRIASYLRHHKKHVFVAVPHPVEHIGDEIGGSVMGHNFAAHKRRARAWMGETGCGVNVDWTNLQYIRE